MTFSWSSTLLDQMEFAWEAQFLPRLDGLTDAEYRWEPVAGCWSVRPDADGRWWQEHTYPDPVPPPFTTIAWRLAHIADFLNTRASNQFGDGSFHRDQLPWTGAADDAIRIVSEAHARWTDGVRALGEDGLSRPCGLSEHRFADSPVLTLVLHINREFLHHAGEVALLRDLYRDTVGRGALTLNAAES
jgi:hypothetical protein